ncbi:DUF2726 domain-containing protein [Mangrovitalea sediminis]|uniref:DUF2726 domain-containing protein n=1 Tax=Mangrovitalea sediminis TaxID=1982043 RepID=UPI000BE55E2A|nr:DUF2726 domain-containing protein [Mangrovitalea sediminis]
MELFAVVLIVVCVVVIAVLNKKELKDRGNGLSDSEFEVYYLNKSVFSPAERSFFGVLEQVLAGTRYKLLAKVRIADLIGVKRQKNHLRFFGRISQKHFDFVICSADTLQPACAIELDDKSHDSPKRKTRDQFVDQVCNAVQLPLLHVPAQKSYSVQDVINGLSRYIEIGAQSSTPEPTSASLVPVDSSDPEDAPLCQRCFAPMVKRRITSGKREGTEFWGCGRFPKCRYVQPIPVKVD